MDVRAAIAHQAGAPLTIETVQLDGPRAGEVLIEVKATGLCHTDEFTRSGADPEGLFPVIFGHEGAGVVVDVGAALSHAIIVSRELGIPCVVSATNATRRIPDGALIEVNGDAGTVRLLSLD